jgi:hypothetical protein
MQIYLKGSKVEEPFMRTATTTGKGYLPTDDELNTLRS